MRRRNNTKTLTLTELIDMPQFTPTQGRYLSFIHAYSEGFGLPPAETEIAEAMGVQPPSVHGMLKTLEKKHLIRRQPGVARSIEILIDPTTLPKWKKKIKRTVREWRPTKNSPQWVKDLYAINRATAKTAAFSAVQVN